MYLTDNSIFGEIYGAYTKLNQLQIIIFDLI